MLEPRANRRPLTGGLLEQHHRASVGAVRSSCRSASAIRPEAVGFVPLRVAAGMQDDTEQAQRLGAVHLVPHRLDRLPAQCRVRRRQVDQVARVRDDRTDARRLHLRAKVANLLGRHDAAAPLVRVFRENLKRVAADARPPARRPAAARRPPTCAHREVDSWTHGPSRSSITSPSGADADHRREQPVTRRSTVRRRRTRRRTAGRSTARW